MRPILCLLAVAAAPAFSQTATRYNISTFAGTAVSGFSGDGGSATAAQIGIPYGLAANASGTVFIADQLNNRIRQVTGGTISTFAGTGAAAYSGDNGQAASAGLSGPAGVAVDASGNLYVAEAPSNVVRKITTAGIVSTIAGNNTAGAGFSGDGGAATSAQLNLPTGVAVDRAGNVYVADRNNQRVRKIRTDGTIVTFAGNGSGGFSGDGLAATASSLASPTGVAVDAAGSVYIADTYNHRIRKVLADGTMITVAGTGNPGYSGDLGPATSADLRNPSGVAVDAGGNLYIADTNNSRIRRVSASGIITTVAGNGRPAYAGDGGIAISASIFFPLSVAIDNTGNVYVADTQNNVVRILAPLPEFSMSPVVSGVIGAGGFGGGAAVAPGAWIEIYGSDLATTARSWTGADFSNQTAPAFLDGTTVTIGGIAAPIAYISGGQVNALVPLNIGAGQQNLTVTTLVGVSTPFSIDVDPARPGVYAPSFLDLDGKQYAAAMLADGSYAAPRNAVSGVATRPAKAGETVTLYGTGFGAVFPSVATGHIATEANVLTGSLQVTLNGTPATVTYAGEAPGAVSLYQINVTVPPGVAGDALSLAITFNGTALRQSLYLAAGN